MTSVGYATLDVIPSMKGLRSQLEKQSAGDFAAAGKSGGKKFGAAAGDEAGKGFKGRFSESLRGFNPLTGLLAGAGIVAAFRNVTDLASEAEQAVGGVGAVFGQYAETVVRDSERAEQALGLSEQAYQQLVTVSGALLKNKGLADYADQAESLVQVGADLAAQYGGPTTQAVEALNAALRGESDPIERYAISLNETAVNAELAATGANNLTGAALEQAKTQARLRLIMQQSADAQGAFAREADTAAGASQRLGAQWENLRTEAGERLLPAMSATFTFMNEQGLPALEAAGGFAADAVAAFRDLPAPVQASAGAFVALRIAASTGLSAAVVSGAGAARSAMDGLRLRTMLAADAFAGARTVTRTFGDTTARVSSGVGRLNASLVGLRAGAQGAGAAIRGSLSSAADLVGGRWGGALIAGTAILTAFWQEHERAKQQIDAFSSSLDRQTGSITEDTYRRAAEGLKDWSDEARAAGISGDELARAVIDGGDALDVVADKFNEYQNRNFGSGMFNRLSNDADDFRGRLETLHSELGQGQQQWRFTEQAADAYKDASKGAADATGQVVDAMGAYRSEIRNTRTELQRLIDKEKERALAAIQQRRDQIALRETLAAAREEARAGARTLDVNTKAGRENMSALLDLADQWTNSQPKVQNARGAYEQMRQKFIEVAEKMGATREEARKLAEQLLNVPKGAKWKFQSEGYKERMAEIQALKDALANFPALSLDYTPQGFNSPGLDFTPRSSGGTSGGSTSRSSTRPNATSQRSSGTTVIIEGDVRPADSREFYRDTQRRAQRASLGGFLP